VVCEEEFWLALESEEVLRRSSIVRLVVGNRLTARRFRMFRRKKWLLVTAW
jgi:hypothetical protein